MPTRIKEIADKPVTVGFMAKLAPAFLVFQLLGGWAFAMWAADARIDQRIAVHNTQVGAHIIELRKDYVLKDNFNEAKARSEEMDKLLLAELKDINSKLDEAKKTVDSSNQRLSRIEGKLEARNK